MSETAVNKVPMKVLDFPLKDIMKLDSSIEIVTGLHTMSASFWRRYSKEFIQFWEHMEQKNRESFLRMVCPTLVQAVGDRFTLAADGTKVYDCKYDNVLLLVPELTIEHLASGDNLLKMYNNMAREFSLISSLVYQVNQLRQLYGEGKYPFTKAEEEARRQELPLAAGSHLVKLGPELDFPSYMHTSDSGKSPADAAKALATAERFYQQGLLVHPFECTIVLQCQHLLLTVLAPILHEFREAVLVPLYSNPSGSSSNSNGANNVSGITIDPTACGRCGLGSNLKQCAKCLVVHYCSRLGIYFIYIGFTFLFFHV
jgi:hypothetical protein